ncbi:MAG: efflux RND transporter periplasmic adaptor subunit [Candidatus Krumholzibacteria bacterium]|nr:efflux RND transporter periplasmic adaptor subunit [Candidatus Krumholzibacteria bacterium]
MNRILKLVLAIPALAMSSCGGNNAVPGGSGFVEATEVTVSSEAAGRIERLYFEEGDRIESGAAIVQIDTAALSLRLGQTEALKRVAETRIESARIQKDKTALDTELAVKEFDRTSTLIKAGSANQQQYDRAKNTLDQSRLAGKAAASAVEAAVADLAKIGRDIELLKKQLADCRPSAPTGGTVVAKYVETGELAAVGKPLVKIARLDTVWVKVYLPPSDLTRIRLGGRAEVDPEDGRTEPLAGTITWISPEAEFTPKNVQTKQARADLVYAVKISIPNVGERLKIGMPVSVKMP